MFPHIGARAVLFLWGMRVVEYNKNIFSKDRQYIFVSNHRSDLDPILTAATLPYYFKFLGKAEVKSWPVFGTLVKKLYIAVQRSSFVSRKQSFETLLNEVDSGASIMIYPEGWSNFSKEYLLPFKRGAFELSARTNLPIVVATIIGSAELWPKPFWKIRPGKVKVYWEEVVDPIDYDNDHKKINQRVFELMYNRLKEEYPQGYIYTFSPPISFEEWRKGQLSKN